MYAAMANTSAERIRVVVKPKPSSLTLTLVSKIAKRTYTPGGILFEWCYIWKMYLSKLQVEIFSWSDYRNAKECCEYSIKMSSLIRGISPLDVLYGHSAKIAHDRWFNANRDILDPQGYWPFCYTFDDIKMVANNPEDLIRQLNQWSWNNEKKVRDHFSASPQQEGQW